MNEPREVAMVPAADRRSAPGIVRVRQSGVVCVALLATLACAGGAGCGDDDDGGGGAANLVVRQRLEALAPAADIGHRGTGVNTSTNPWPENSLASFVEGMAEGADGIELDVELTADGKLVVMHDDTLDRTTTCSGCVSAWTLDDIRECLLLAGSGEATEEHPPTLEEVYGVLPADALVNVELKVFEAPCATAETTPAVLARTAVREIRRLGVAERTLFSSFDLVAATTLKSENPDLYSALLDLVPSEETISVAAEAGLDAINPFVFVPGETVASILALGMQVNVWTVNTPALMEQNLEKGVTSIITDDPDVLAALLPPRD